MNRIVTRLTPIMFFLMSPTIVSAQDMSASNQTSPDNEVFARQGDAVLTQSELDAALSKIPSDIRLAYLRDGGRVDQIIASLLSSKILAADAGDYAEDPMVRIRLKLAMEKELAEAWTQKVVEDAPEGDYEALAYEYYLANPEAYMADESIDVSHVLIGSRDRSEEEAYELATAVRLQVVAGEISFDEAIYEYSDDPSKAVNGGRFPRTIRGKMVPEFEEVAFSMENPGDISEPVKTAYGYHIIKLDAKYTAQPLPFENVKPEILERVRRTYRGEYQKRYVRSLVSDPIAIEDGAVEKMVKRYFGENLELAPQFPE